MGKNSDSVPKQTIIDSEFSPEQYERPGWVSVCEYGSIRPEPNEIGGIFLRVRNMRVEHGVLVYDAECVERVFVGPNV